MTGRFTFDPNSFKGMEHAGWDNKAADYGDFFGAITAEATEPLLDAAGVRAGARVLEVCCGPGYGSAAAVGRGASALGVDFAPAMVEIARQAVPGARFEEGDAEALAFADSSFDAVVCPFGLLHLPEPERGITEAFRVLAPGGRYALTVWCAPEKAEVFNLVAGAVQAHGTLDVPLPEAPPMFRFADHGECTRALGAAGFVDVAVREIPPTYRPKSAQDVLDMVYKSAVRTPMVLEAQSQAARERIHRAILEGAEAFRRAGRIGIAMPAVLASGRKP